jgi:hypothetical protein
MLLAISKSLSAIKRRRNQAKRVRTLLGLLPENERPKDIDGLVAATFDLTQDDDDDDDDDEAEGEESAADDAIDNDTGHGCWLTLLCCVAEPTRTTAGYISHIAGHCTSFAIYFFQQN